MVVDERFLYLLSKASLRRLETVLIKVRHRTFRTSGGFDCANFGNNVTEKFYNFVYELEERGRERERERDRKRETQMVKVSTNKR